MNALLAAAVTSFGVLLAVDPVPGENDLRPGWGYAAVFFGLAIVTVLLWLSLRKQLGRIKFDRESPPEDPERR